MAQIIREEDLPENFDLSALDEPQAEQQATTAAPQQQHRGVGGDILESLLSTPDTAIRMLAELPEHIKRGTAYGRRHPFKSIGQAGLGGIEGIAGLLSIKPKLDQYIDDKIRGGKPATINIGGREQQVPQKPTPYQALQDVEQLTGAKSDEPGAAEMRGLGQLALGGPALAKLPSALLRAGTVGAAAGGQEGDPIQSALLALAGEKGGKAVGKGAKAAIRPLQAKKLAPEVERTGQQAQAAQSQLQDIQSALKEQFSETSPEAFTRSAQQKIAEAEQLQPVAARQPRETENILPMEGEIEAREAVPQAEQSTEAARNETATYLNHGKEHDVHAARELVKEANKEKMIGSRMYRELENNIADKNVQVPRTPDVKQIEKTIAKLAKDSKTDVSQFETLKNMMIEQQSQGHDIIPAIDFWNNWKATKAAAEEARRMGYKEAATASERDMQPHWREQAEKLQELADQQADILKEHIGDDDASLLENANEHWKKRVIPLQKNKSLWQAQPRNRGRIDSADMIREFRGDAPGNQLIREFAKRNPELAKNMLGQRYAKKPHDLISDVNEGAQQYVDALPDLQSLVKRMQESAEHQQRATQRTDELQDRVKSVKESLSKEAKQQKEARNARANIEKLQHEIDAKQKAAEQLRTAINKKNISQAEHKEKAEKLHRMQQDIKALNSRLWTAAKVLATLSAGASAFDMLKKFLR